jgi:hypothetical protein
VSDANEAGKAAVQDLMVILDYFDETDKEIKVTDLPKVSPSLPPSFPFSLRPRCLVSLVSVFVSLSLWDRKSSVAMAGEGPSEGVLSSKLSSNRGTPNPSVSLPLKGFRSKSPAPLQQQDRGTVH